MNIEVRTLLSANSTSSVILNAGEVFGAIRLNHLLPIQCVVSSGFSGTIKFEVSLDKVTWSDATDYLGNALTFTGNSLKYMNGVNQYIKITATVTAGSVTVFGA